MDKSICPSAESPLTVNNLAVGVALLSRVCSRMIHTHHIAVNCGCHL